MKKTIQITILALAWWSTLGCSTVVKRGAKGCSGQTARKATHVAPAAALADEAGEAATRAGRAGADEGGKLTEGAKTAVEQAPGLLENDDEQ